MEYEDAMDTAEEFPLGLACALDAFRERNVVLEYIKSLPDIYQNPATVELTIEKYMKILDRYQEQPHLLDSCLSDLIDACLAIVRNVPDSVDETPTPTNANVGNDELESSSPVIPLKHLSLKFLRHIFKVRGHKKVTQRMPHEISDLLPVLEFLESIDLSDSNLWESTSVLIYWMSILVINPFDLKLLDNTMVDKDMVKKSDSIAQRILNVGLKCIVLNNNVGHATPILLANLLTRPDMLKRDPPQDSDRKIYDLETFVGWCCGNLKPELKFAIRMGALSALASLFKQAKRQEIIKYGRKVLVALLASNYSEGDTLIRKMGAKLIQRIGILFMKTKIAPWRYQRGSRSLVDNLQPDGKKAVTQERNKSNANDGDGDNEEEYEELSLYANEIESVLDKLLRRLEDKDTIVRWSAAKGIGRIVNRLPKDYGNEVVESVLRLFTPRESNMAWQGGCLALAELGRRGLLLPARLPETIEVIQRALLYDEVRGNFSVGSHVRDAACYVLWAFARAFEPEILQPYVHDIATALILTMVFDREVNCRRAAAAAFQENVGRQGNFPYGMDIITVADYFTVGNRTNAFTKVSVEIANFPAYTRPMIDHLIELKYNHFDPTIRDLTAKTLGNMAHLNPDHVLSVVMNQLLPVATESDIPTSHGAILCLSSVMAQLSSLGLFKMEGNNQIDIRNIALSLIHLQFRPTGHHHRTGHELLRQAINYYIKCCSVSKMPFHKDTELLDAWYSLLEENVSFYEANVRLSAADALPSFLNEYYYTQPEMRSKVGYFVGILCENLSSTVMTTRVGYAQAIGKMPLHLLKDAFSSVIRNLTQCAGSSSSFDADWAESRRAATNALACILEHNIINTPDEDWSTGIPLDLLEYTLVWEQFIHGMNDYTTDKRGDVGSWVREAAMTGIKALMIGLHNYEIANRVTLMNPSQYTYLLALVSKQCVEKIDNVRVHAGKIFSSLLHYTPPFDIAHREYLMTVFPKDVCATMNWRSSSVTFRKFSRLLSLPEYSNHVLCGFIISGGSLSDTVLRDATFSVQRYLDDSDQAEVRRIADVMVQIFKDNQKVERISLPIMKFWAHLLESGLFNDILCDDEKQHFGPELINCVKCEIQKSNRIEKLVAGVEVLCELLQGSHEMVNSSLKRLTVLLCHPYPRIRVVTAQKIYEALVTYGDTIDRESDKGIVLMSKTKWDLSLEQLRPIRNEFCTVMGVPIPVPLPQKTDCNQP